MMEKLVKSQPFPEDNDDDCQKADKYLSLGSLNEPFISFVDEIKNDFYKNKSSLSVVELTQLCVLPDQQLNAKIFSVLDNLKKLGLFGVPNANTTIMAAAPQLINMDFLPTSLENLEVNELTCGTSDLIRMVAQLKKLQSLELIGTGKKGDLGVNETLLKIIARRGEGIKGARVGPLALDRFKMKIVANKFCIYVKEYKLVLELQKRGFAEKTEYFVHGPFQQTEEHWWTNLVEAVGALVANMIFN